MHLHRILRRFVLMRPDDVGASAGGGISPAPAVESAPAAPVESAAPAAPASMLEAIEQGLGQSGDSLPGQPRDEFGRFAPKNADGTPVAPEVSGDPVAAQKPPEAAVQKPEAAEDELQAPEGLSPKASERFQKLANTVKDLEQKVQEREQAISYVQETFQQNGIQREQFEQAAQVIGALNRGDLEAAEQVLRWQLEQIAIARGRPVEQINPLGNYPDLMQAVADMQLSEQHALQIARGRVNEQAQIRQQQAAAERQQEAVRQQQSQHREQQAVQTGLAAVDAFSREMAAKDVDWPAIEEKLLPAIPKLLAGIPPARWKEAVQTQYELIKSVATGGVRYQSPPQGGSGQVLRASGQGGGAAPPRSMFEAMFPQG